MGQELGTLEENKCEIQRRM